MRLYRVIASGALALALLVPAGAYAFEFTKIGGGEAGQAAQYLDPLAQSSSNSLGGLQFEVNGGSGSQVDDSALPPWQFRPPPRQGSYNSTIGGSGFRSFR